MWIGIPSSTVAYRMNKHYTLYLYFLALAKFTYCPQLAFNLRRERTNEASHANLAWMNNLLHTKFYQ